MMRYQVQPTGAKVKEGHQVPLLRPDLKADLVPLNTYSSWTDGTRPDKRP